MKKLILTILLALSLNAQDIPLWEQKDKQFHFTASAGISALTTEIFVYNGTSQIKSILYGIGVSLLVGLAKEAYDQYSYGGADIEDGYADVLGAVGGITPRLVYNWEF